MVLGAWQRRGGALALCLLLPFGCAGGYPLPPTHCDDWCNATRGLDSCGVDYDPAGCVATCEAQNLSSEACAWAFEPAMACFDQHPNAAAQLCYYDPILARPCQFEVQQLIACAGAQIDPAPQE